MTPAALNSLINLKCKTNDTTFTQADKLVYINAFKDEIASKIIDKDAGYFLVPVTFNLVANQREYALPEDTINRIQKVEIKFSSTDDRYPSTYLKDWRGSEDEDQITGSFTNNPGEFYHVFRRRSILILSGTIADVTSGARVWYAAYPADVTDLTDSATDISVDPTTTTFGFPRQFHELLARRVAIEWKGNQPTPVKLNTMERNYEINLKEQLDSLNPNDASGEVIAEDLSVDDTGDDGWDY